MSLALAAAAAATTAAAPLLKIRTITTGITLEPGRPTAEWQAHLLAAAEFNAAAAAAYTSAGYEVQTTRISTNSFESWLDVADKEAALQTFRDMDATLTKAGGEHVLAANMLSVGPASTPEALALVPDMVALGPRISASGVVASPHDAAAARRVAEAVLRIAAETEGGEGNFQFCASFNVPPNVPFFPAAFHAGPCSFALGCETSAIVADALPRAAGDLARAHTALVEGFEAQMRPLEAVAHALAAEHGHTYDGIDASIAPYPTAPPPTRASASAALGRAARWRCPPCSQAP